MSTSELFPFLSRDILIITVAGLMFISFGVTLAFGLRYREAHPYSTFGQVSLLAVIILGLLLAAVLLTYDLFSQISSLLFAAVGVVSTAVTFILVWRLATIDTDRRPPQIENENYGP